jgi:hypothetical protein
MRAGVLALAAVAVLALGACHVRVVAWGEVDRDAVGRLLDTVSRARGLPVRRSVRVRLQDARELARQVETDLRTEVSSGSLSRRQRALAKLGLVGWDDDLEAFYREVYSDEPAGYYAPEEGRLYVVVRDAFRSDVGEVIGAVTGRDPVYGETLAHELAHALVDQRVDLAAFLDGAAQADARMARRALGEGDATRVGFLYAGGRSFARHLRKLRRLLSAADAESSGPEYLRDELRFPYLAGGAFVEHLYRRGGWHAVNAAYDAPPLSTEQILHPERYPADAPVALRVPADVTPRADARRIFDDVLGERGVRALFRRNDKAGESDALASGWDGDRAVVWDAAGRLFLHWTTAWDTEEDARAFAQAYRDLVVDSYRTRALRRDYADDLLWSTPEGPVGIRRQGARVLVFEGFEPVATSASASGVRADP